MTTPAKMDDDLGQLTERILNLTLEIIYLLTGEGYKVVKQMSGEPLTPSNSPTDTPPPSLKNEINSKKILEVTNKIIDLLTGETGSVADLNIVVKEEEEDEIDDDDDWVYIGYKHHFNNVRVKDLPPLASPDGSRKRNLTHPRDSTLDDHNYLTIPQHEQCEKDTEIISEDNEEEETPASGDLQSLKEGGTTATLTDKETSSSDITDGSRKRNPSETSVDPWNSILEDHNYVKRSVEDELENDIEMNSEDYEETPMGDQLSENEIKESVKEKQTTLRITIEQDHNVSITSISSCTSCEDNNEDDNDTTQLAPGIDASTPPLHLNVPEKLSDESKNNESFSCSECDDSFSDESCYSLHVKTHTGRTATQEDHATPHRDQCGKQTNEETEVDEEEEMPSTEEGHDDNENGTTQRSPGGDSSPQTPHRKPSVDKPTSTKLTYRKIFSCPECENSFADTLSYILHMEMHSGLTVLHQDHTIPRYDQGENKINTQPEVKKEEVTPVKGGQESTNEAGITTTMTESQTSLNKTPESGPDVPITRTRRCTSYEDNRIKDDGATQHSAGGDSSTRSLHPTETLSIDVPKSVQPKSKKIFSCSECENSFTDKSSYILHKKTHSRKTTLRSDRAIPRHDQCEKDTNVRSEVHEAEETPTRGRQQKVGTKVTMKGKKSTLNITPEHDVPNTRSRRSASREEKNSKDRGTTQRSSRADSSPRPSRPTVSEKLSIDNLKSNKKKNKKIISCPKCKKSFSNKSRYAVHMKRRCGPRRLQERAKEKEIRTEVNKEEVTPMRGGLRSMKNVEGTTALKVKRTLSVSPEHEHHIPNTRKRLRTSCPDSDLKDNDTVQHSPAVKFSTQPLHLTVPKNKDVVTSTRVSLKSMKDVAVMETKKVKKTSSNTTPEHGHDLPNTRRSLRTSHPDHNKKEDGTTQESPKIDCSAHPLLPTAPENKEVVTTTRAGLKSMKDVAVMETKKEKKKSLDITPEHGHDLPNTRRSLRTSHPDHNKKEEGTTQESPKVDCSAHPLLPTAPENKEVVTSMRAGVKSMKDVAVMETKKEKKNSLDITPEHGHDLPNTGRSLRTSHPDHNKKEDGTTQESPKVDRTAHPLLPTAPANKDVVTSTRAGLKSLKDVAVMETKKEKKNSLDITPEHGHDLPNTRRSLRTSHPDHNKKEDGTTQQSPEVDCSAHPLLPTAPENKEVVTPLRVGHKSMKEVEVMETKKEKKYSLDITPEHEHNLPNTRRSLRTSHPESSKKDNGSTRRPPEVDSSAPLLHPTLPENKEGVTPMRSSRQCMKEAGMTVTTKNKKSSITPENEHDVPITRSKHRPSHPDDKTRGNRTTQQSSGVLSTTQPSPSSITRKEAEVTPLRGGRLHIHKIGIMERLKARKTSLTITPEHEHSDSNTKKSLCTPCPDLNAKENGTTQQSPGPDTPAKPLHHPTMTEQFLDINKMFFSCSECGKSFTKKLYFAIHMRMHTVRRPFQEEGDVPQHDQCEKNTDRKEEVNVEEDQPTKSRQQSKMEVGTMATIKKKKTSLKIKPTRGHDILSLRRRSRSSFPDSRTENKGATQSSPRMHSSPKPVRHAVPGQSSPRMHSTPKPLRHAVPGQSSPRMHSSPKPLRHAVPAQSSPRMHSSPKLLRPTLPKKRSIDKQERDKPKSKTACPECGKFFCSESYVAIHLRSHTGKRPYKCLKCGKSFTYNSSLLRHQRHHSEVRPHKCSLCEKCFKEKSALRQHLRSHTGERPYPCPECDQRFTQKEHLHRHVRVHRGETPFACKLCGKRFTRKDLLTSHEQRHVNERPYTCPECGNGFTNQFCLGRHIRLLHS